MKRGAVAIALVFSACVGCSAPSTKVASSASSARSGAPSAASSFSPIPANAPGYATAQDAGIAGVEAETGVTYSGGTCQSSQSCLGLPAVYGGQSAAEVKISYTTPGVSPTNCFAYVFFASAWHPTSPVLCTSQVGFYPLPGQPDRVRVPGSCANVRQAPSLNSKVVTCLKDGTQVSIDSAFPQYVDGHIWWSINGHQGWMAHDYLISSPLQIIAAQPGDLPSGLVTCSWSGDFASYASNVKAIDPAWAQHVLDFWQQLRAAGATASWVQDLSYNEDACKGFLSGAGLFAHATSIVVQFGDQAGATSAYTSYRTTLFGALGASLAGAPTETGSATGLGANSFEATPNNLPGATLEAAWQKDAYYMLFFAEGLPLSDDKLALAKIDVRVP
jgi:hypothetical protein